MGRVVCSMAVSLDGFSAGPKQSLENPLGVGGERLHEWKFGLASFAERHGGEAGGELTDDDEIVAEAMDRAGAHVMGRRMFGGGEGPWGDEPWEGWWGDDPPYRAPVFVLTHHARDPVEKQGGTTFYFVTEGIESAIKQAKAAASDKDVAVAGGADVLQQCIRAGLLDELEIHVSPVLLGSGTRLLDGLDPSTRVEKTRVVDSPGVTHLRYRVVT